MGISRIVAVAISVLALECKIHGALCCACLLQGPPAGPRRGSLNSGQHPQLNSAVQSQPHAQEQQQEENVTCWSSADRLNVSIGLMYALCNLAKDVGAVAGFCVPRPQLLRRWLQVKAIPVWPLMIWFFPTPEL